MGIYINPPLPETKEEWLAEHGTEVDPVYPLEDGGMSLVCLVWNPNGEFSAAGVIFDEREWVEFSRQDDPRSKKWFVVPTADLEEVAGP